MRRKEFGERVRFLRNIKCLTMGRLAELAGVSEIHLGNIERGSASPSFEMINKLAKALETDPLNFFLPSRENLEPLDDLTVSEAIIDWRKYVSSLGSWEYEPESDTLAFSKTLNVMLGFKEERSTVSFEMFLQRIHPDDRALMREGWASFRSGDFEHRNMFRYYRRDGELRLCMIQGIAERDDSGKSIRFQGILLDITEQRRLETVLASNQSSIEELIEKRTKDLLEAQKQAENESANRAIAEQRAKEGEKLYRELFEKMHDGFIRFDKNGIVTLANPSAADILGFQSPSELHGRHVESLYSTPDEYRHNFSTLVENGRMANVECRFKRKDGSFGWASCNYQLLVDAVGDIAGGESIFRDITDQRMAEMDRAEMLAVLNETANIAKTGGWKYTPGENQIYWSNQLCIIHDVPTGHMPTLQEARSFYHFSDQKILIKMWKKAIEKGESWDIELILKTATGREKWVRSMCTPQKLENGTFYLRGVIQDITERKRIRDALVHSEQRMKTLLLNSPIGIAFGDIEGILTECNHAFANMLGYEKNELIGRNFRSLSNADDLNREWRHIEEILNNKKDSYHIEKRFVQKSGKTIWGDLTSCFSRSENQRDSFAVGFIIDISERKQQEDALRESEARLRRIIDSMPILIDAFDANDGIVFWNRECEKITGYSKDEIINNKDAIRLLYPDSEYRKKMLFRFKALEQNFHNEESVVTGKNNQLKTISWHSVSKDHPVPGWAAWAIGIDVTEQKKVFNALQKEKEKYRFVAENVGDIVWTMDEQHIFTYVNPAFEKILGYTLEDVKGDLPEGFLSPESKKKVTAHVEKRQRSVEQGAIDRAAYQMVLKQRSRSGEQIVMEVTTIPIIDESDCFQGIVGVGRDITSISRVADALRACEERFLHVLQHVPLLIHAYDETDVLVFWNKESELITGYTSEEVVGNPDAFNLLYPDEEYREYVFNKWRLKKEKGECKFDLITKNGVRRTILWRNFKTTCSVPGWKRWEIGVDVTDKISENHINDRQTR